MPMSLGLKCDQINRAKFPRTNNPATAGSGTTVCNRKIAAIPEYPAKIPVFMPKNCNNMKYWVEYTA